MTDVSGWQYYSGQFNKEAHTNGYGKKWYSNGNVFIGKWNCGRRTEGKMFELKPDKTHSLFEVNYDE
jgi:hypothetical protein